MPPLDIVVFFNLLYTVVDKEYPLSRVTLLRYPTSKLCHELEIPSMTPSRYVVNY